MSNVQTYNFNLIEVENYIKTIFDLQKKLEEKDAKINMLKFELALEKELLENVKKFHLQLSSIVK